MDARNSQRRTSAARSHLGALSLRCLLLLAVWQGPIPWCHCHGTVDHLELSPGLPEHLRSHHAGHDPYGHGCWHLHFILPETGGQTPGEPSEDRYQRLPMISTADASPAEVDSLWDEMPVSEVLFVQSAVPSAAIRNAGLSTAHFYDGFAPELALPMRFCVARC